MESKAIGINLRSLNNLIMRYLEQHANKKKVDSLTMTNAWIIEYIAEHSDRDVFQRDFEREFRITRSTISKVINLMVQKGFIERQSVEHDARLKKLVLTPKALEIADLMCRDNKMLNEQLTKGFSDEELDTLYSYIERMQNNLTQ